MHGYITRDNPSLIGTLSLSSSGPHTFKSDFIMTRRSELSSSIQAYGFTYGNDDLTKEDFEAMAAEAEAEAAAKLQQRASLQLSLLDSDEEDAIIGDLKHSIGNFDPVADCTDRAVVVSSKDENKHRDETHSGLLQEKSEKVAVEDDAGRSSLVALSGGIPGSLDEPNANSRSKHGRKSMKRGSIMNMVIGSLRNVTQIMKDDIEDKKKASDISNKKKMEKAVRKSVNVAEYKVEGIGNEVNYSKGNRKEQNAQMSNKGERENNERALRGSKRIFGSIIKSRRSRESLDKSDTTNMTAHSLSFGEVSGLRRNTKGGGTNDDLRQSKAGGTREHVDRISSILYN